MYNELDTFSHCALPSHLSFNYSKKMASTSNEYQLQFAFQTFEKDLQLSIHKVVQLYNVLYLTLFIRINDVFTHVNIMTNSRKLTTLKEEIIV